MATTMKQEAADEEQQLDSSFAPSSIGEDQQLKKRIWLLEADIMVLKDNRDMGKILVSTWGHRLNEFKEAWEGVHACSRVLSGRNEKVLSAIANKGSLAQHIMARSHRTVPCMHRRKPGAQPTEP
jgi:hypothetical protein